MVECPKNHRNRATLIPIILNHVHEGTHIITDDWKVIIIFFVFIKVFNKLFEAYYVLLNYGYQHTTVNHSKNYIKPGTNGLVHFPGAF